MTHKPITTIPDMLLTIALILAIGMGLMLTYAVDVCGCWVMRQPDRDA